jgi:hypothetical protein
MDEDETLLWFLAPSARLDIWVVVATLGTCTVPPYQTQFARWFDLADRCKARRLHGFIVGGARLAA